MRKPIDFISNIVRTDFGVHLHDASSICISLLNPPLILSSRIIIFGGDGDVYDVVDCSSESVF